MPRSKKSAAGTSTVPRKSSKDVYPDRSAELRCIGSPGGPLTAEESKELIGWTVEGEGEGEGEDFGTDFQLRDTFGRKVRLTRNPTNRPLKHQIAHRYALEFLRGVWQFNMESIVFGKSGELRDGQHRLVGHILAEEIRSVDQKKWGHEPIVMEALLGFGVEDSQEVADSFDKGQSRKLDDVIFRRHSFDEGTSEGDQKKISRTLAGAIRLVWLRSGGKEVSSAPHFPHSEALEFYGQHPDILKSAEFIIQQDKGEGNDRRISALLSLPYAVALHYMMSDASKKKAADFWKQFASGTGLEKGSPILALRTFLQNATAGSGKQRDAIVGSVVKAWNAFCAGDELTTKSVKLKQTKDENGKFVFAEFPRIGGIDSEPETKDELDFKSKMVLSALCDGHSEMTYQSISDETGIPRSTVARICATATDGNHLMAEGLVTVEVIENEGDKDEVVVSATDKGRSQVR